jgi:hypothetical protein
MCGYGRWLNWVSNEAWVVTVYRIYKFADRGVVVGGTLKYGYHSLLNVVTALFIRFGITEMCSCIKNVLQMVSRFTWF